MKEFVEFKVGDVDLRVRKPRLDELREAQKIHTRAFHDAVTAGAVLRAKLDEVLVKQGLWDDAKDIEIKTLQKQVSELEVKLLKGGLKYSEGEKIAFDIIDKRNRIKEIFGIKLLYDSKTAEAQADDARTDYLVSVCLVYNTPTEGFKSYFKSLEDYLNAQNTAIAVEGYRQFLFLMNDTEDNPEQSFTEYKFLRKFKKVDEKLRLINKDGKLVDREGRLIDENGRYIDKDGGFVDLNGNPVDESGNYKFDAQPFLDDEGNPILDESGKPLVV